MLKVYLVESEDWDYNNYDSFVVVAENEEKAIELVKDDFKEDQGALTAKEVSLQEEGVVLGSFNAG